MSSQLELNSADTLMYLCDPLSREPSQTMRDFLPTEGSSYVCAALSCNVQENFLMQRYIQN